MKPKITIIGGGISGLTAAINLHRSGFEVQIIEATDRVGGRIKTDVVNGYRLDRGFQVLLTAYPECKKLLDYKKLNLKRFLPGSIVLTDSGQFEISDPFRRPSAFVNTVAAPAGTILDKILTFVLKIKLLYRSIDTIFSQKQISSIYKLEQYGFSKKMINNFYRPFFSGIFLENKLTTSGNMFDFVMKMFSEGDAAIPELGMEEIPKQLLAMLPKNTVRYNTTAVNIIDNKIFLNDNTVLDCDKIIIATEATSIVKNFLPKINNKYQSVTTIYFTADSAPFKHAIVAINASSKTKYVNNLVVMTNLSAQYAPANKVLISVSINGIPDLSNDQLVNEIKNELQMWYNNQTIDWKLIKMYQINYALPNQEQVQNDFVNNEFKVNENLYICGDHLLNGSINAAMKTGRLVAENIIKNY